VGIAKHNAFGNFTSRRKMNLLTKELEKKIPKLYSQEKVKDPMVVVKFFNPCGSATWWIIEGEWQKHTEDDDEDYIMFGLAMLFGPEEAELGYISLNELESIKTKPFGLGIERDKFWTPKLLSEVKKEFGIR
jgi:hypothetical protein